MAGAVDRIGVEWASPLIEDRETGGVTGLWMWKGKPSQKSYHKIGDDRSSAHMEHLTEVTDAYPGRNIKVIDLAPIGAWRAVGTKIETKIGMVGPMSNYAAPPQLVENVPYQDLDQMNAFARRWRAEHRGKWFTVRKLSGFCLLMTREVYDAIGGLDERFGLGFYDDDDLAERARRAGFGLAVAQDLFVHHFGSRTFVGNGVDAGRVLDENAKRFAEKWGDSVPRGVRIGLKAYPSGPRGAGGHQFLGEGGPVRARHRDGSDSAGDGSNSRPATRLRLNGTAQEKRRRARCGGSGDGAPSYRGAAFKPWRRSRARLSDHDRQRRRK